MQLLINTELRRSILTVELETINFTKAENDLLDQFGEFVFDFEKVYQNDFPVSIHKKIRTNFKVRIKFDGSESEEAMEKATLAANEFIEEIEEKIDEQYDQWIISKQDMLLNLADGLGKKVSKVVKQDTLPQEVITQSKRCGYHPFYHV